MKLYPAIDLLGGKAVRLEEGRRDRATVFHDDPPALVESLTRDGADRLHVVDLDGAFAGSPQQTDLIRRIVASSRLSLRMRRAICSCPTNACSSSRSRRDSRSSITGR